MFVRIFCRFLTAVIASAVLLASCSRPKTGYVDIFKLVSEFDLQKEYTEAAQASFHEEKALIDSIIYTYRLQQSSALPSAEQELYAALRLKTQERNKEIETMIWNRLNPYISDFGKAKGYTYIYGANGTGNVLYASSGEDITQELIEYVGVAK